MQTINFSTRQRMTRILTLIVLSSVIAEVLFGATHIISGAREPINQKGIERAN